MVLNKVAVIGAGTMGRGIAQWFAQAGVYVELIDVNQEALTDSIKKIKNSWDKLTAKGKFSQSQSDQFLKNLQAKKLSDISADCDLVIEAIIENLEIKKSLFKSLDQSLSDKTVIASNTSSFPMKKLSSDLSAHRKKNFLGLHFFNPATIMKLVEIISSDKTSPELAKNLFNWFEEKGKKPAQCIDSPGFIVNRVARNFYGESLRIAQSDDKDRFQQVDNILKECGGFRMGPFELMDLIGIDINLDVTNSVHDAYDKHPRFAPHELQINKVKSGHYGRKNGKGFYSYE